MNTNKNEVAVLRKLNGIWTDIEMDRLEHNLSAVVSSIGEQPMVITIRPQKSYESVVCVLGHTSFNYSIADAKDFQTIW